MTDHAPFALNLNESGPHVVHRYPASESCNLDDTDKRVYLDELEVKELVANGRARKCERCFENES